MRVFFCLLITMIFVSACSAEPQTSLEVPREGVASAVVNLNISGRSASLGALPIEDTALFVAEVGDIRSVDFAVESGEQSFIALGDTQADEYIWDISVHPNIPTAFVVDLNEATVSAYLSALTVPRFDIVSNASSLELSLPASAAQLALAADNSGININVPEGGSPQISQFVSEGSFIVMTVAEGVSFDAEMTISAGGFTLIVPETTAGEIIVETANQAEISLPNSERLDAEVGSYNTADLRTATTSQILLRVSLSGATLRVAHE